MKLKNITLFATTFLPAVAYAGIPTSVSVPEPQTGVLFGVAAVAVYLFKRKK